MKSRTFCFLCPSVSRKGEQFLSSAGPDHQPPLVLPVTSEMVDDEDNKSTSGEVGEIKGLSTLECEGFSEVSKLSIFCSFLFNLFILVCSY